MDQLTLPSPGNGQWWNYKNEQIPGGRERLRQVCSRAYFVACDRLHFTLYSLQSVSQPELSVFSVTPIRWGRHCSIAKCAVGTDHHSSSVCVSALLARACRRDTVSRVRSRETTVIKGQFKHPCSSNTLVIIYEQFKLTRLLCRVRILNVQTLYYY